MPVSVIGTATAVAGGAIANATAVPPPPSASSSASGDDTGGSGWDGSSWTICGSASSSKVCVLAAPRHSRLAGRTLTLVKRAVPGSQSTSGRLDVEVERLLGVGARHPDRDRQVAAVVDGHLEPPAEPAVADLGCSSTPTSANVPTSTVPSATDAPSGSSCGIALTAQWASPGVLVGARGGAIVTVTTSSVDGEQPNDGRFDRDPGRGIAERLERELVDDVAGVAYPQRGGDRRPGVDDEL